MISRAFAVVCDSGYYPGLLALLNSIVAYHGREIPVFVYYRGLSREKLKRLKAHKAAVTAWNVARLGFHGPGMWEAKQQTLAHCLGRVRCLYLLDADLVLTSAQDDVFALAESGKIVGSLDGEDFVYDDSYAVYGLDLPGRAEPYLNSGSVCLDVVRHWDLAGLWAFSASYCAYGPGKGPPLALPGHGDQGLFNSIAILLGKEAFFHPLPEGTWCDSGGNGKLEIRRVISDGRLEVWNATVNAPQRLVHSTGPKWWTAKGREHAKLFGDKYRCFQHFRDLDKRPEHHEKYIFQPLD